MAEKFGNTWWSERWLQSLSHIDNSNRLPRGATYARQGAVTKINIKGGEIVAKVQGSYRYTVNIDVPEFSEKEKDTFINALINQPALIASLLNHQLSPDVMTIAEKLHLKIFPTSWESFDMYCSCPDHAVPCKHLAAVIYKLSREIDNDPFLVFKLHGLDIIDELTKQNITIDEKSQSVPNITELIQTTEENTPFDQEQIYAPLSYTNIPNLVTILPQMLTDAPVFEAKQNFLDHYKKNIADIAKRASNILKNPEKLNLYRTNIVIEKHDVIDHIVASNQGYSNSVRCHIKSLETESANVLFSPLASAVLNIDSEQINRYTPSVVAFHRLILTTIMLIKNGAIVPQPYTIGKSDLQIRWLPAMLNDEVANMIEKYTKLIPNDIFIFINKKGTKTTESQVRNAPFEALVYAITQIVNILYLPNSFTEIGYLFFSGRPIDLTSVGNSTIGISIASWLNRFYIKNEDFRHVIIIEETDENDIFQLSIAIEDANKNDGLPISLNKIIIDNEYANERFKIMQSLTMFSSQIVGLADYINSNAETPIRYTLKQLSQFIFSATPMLRMLGVKIMLPKSLINIVRPKAQLKISSNNEGGFFTLNSLLNFEWSIAIGNKKVSLAEFEKLLEKSEQLIKIKGQYVYLSETDVAHLLDAIKNGIPTQTQLMQAALAGEFDGQRIELTDELQKQIDNIRKLEKIDIPTEIKATLRPYQQTGYWWLYRNSKLGFGSIIADDMGLGKTLQVITLLQKLKNDSTITLKKPAVVIVPTALLFNWTKEIERFAPTLSSSIYHGPNRDLAQCNTEIILTTYGVTRSDNDKIKKLKPSVLIIDEAQNIKNISTEQTKAIKSISAPIKIAMSGTPIENRLSEFWSIMDFTNKGFLGNIKNFNAEFSKPIQTNGDENVAMRFRKITSPFLMRRLKTDKNIISDLPDKIEINEYASLTKEQTSLYEQTVQEAMKTIEGVEQTDSKSLFKRSALILQMMLSLKQICNHPTQFLKNGILDPHLSGKTEILFNLLENIIDNNEKVLIFTQFAEMGEMLCKFITNQFDEQPMFYNGSCTVKEREEMIHRFQNNHSDRIFVLTIKSAGIGLNLTAATHVIHYDLWWNPAVEAQATDRAYRIGQKHNVQVHRFITRNTFEERINEMIQAKKNIANMTVATGENWIGKLSNEELKEIFL